MCGLCLCVDVFDVLGFNDFQSVSAACVMKQSCCLRTTLVLGDIGASIPYRSLYAIILSFTSTSRFKANFTPYLFAMSHYSQYDSYLAFRVASLPYSTPIRITKMKMFKGISIFVVAAILAHAKANDESLRGARTASRTVVGDTISPESEVKDGFVNLVEDQVQLL